MNKKKILFLAANPEDTTRLQLDKEHKTISTVLKQSELGNQFHLVSEWAVDSNSLRLALLREHPEIVHFSGHGEGQAGLILVGSDGRARPATAKALAGLFELHRWIECVLLNACFSQEQSEAIVQHINYVIVMKQAVRDDAAIAFATGFYAGLGHGRSIEDAFKLGCNAIEFEEDSFSDNTRKAIPVDSITKENTPLPDYLIPTLLIRQTVQEPPETASLSEKLRAPETPSQIEARQQYQKRLKALLADRREFTLSEKIQLGIFANVLGLSETEANRIWEAELNQIEQANQEYERVLRQTIEGIYPLDAEVLNELKALQNKLALVDSEVEKISVPILIAAEEKYQQGLRSLAVSHLQEGVGLKDQGKLEEAIVEYQQAIKLDPNLAIAHSNLGDVLRYQHRPKEAIAAYREAIQLDPNLAIARNNLAIAHNDLGLALHKQNKLSEAIPAYREAIQLDPNLAEAHQNLGVALRFRGKLKDAQRNPSPPPGSSWQLGYIWIIAVVVFNLYGWRDWVFHQIGWVFHQVAPSTPQPTSQSPYPSPSHTTTPLLERCSNGVDKYVCPLDRLNRLPEFAPESTKPKPSESP